MQMILHRLNLLIALILFCSSFACAQQEGNRVLVVGARIGNIKWNNVLPGVKSLNPAAMPADANALAEIANVLIIRPDALTKSQQQAVEAFVRGGGGLLLDGMGDRSRWVGGILDVMSPAIGRYEARTALGQATIGETKNPLNDLDLTSFPRIASLINVATPDHTPSGRLNFLSAWYYSKPLWHDDWQEWLLASDPANTPLLSVARYGAGQVAIANWSSLVDADAEIVRDVVTRLVSWLAGNGIVAPYNMPTVAVQGFTLPEWYSKPLSSGMSGMGEKTTINDFLLPPEALQEAGYQIALDTKAAKSLILMGNDAQATAPPGVDTVLRLPAGIEASKQNFDISKLLSVSKTSSALLVEDEKLIEVKLPHRSPADNSPLPTVELPAGNPQINLPTSWKIAFTHDSDSKIDLQQAWNKIDFDDTKWQEGKIGAQMTSLFGEQMGYDGAIWYRGIIDIPAEIVLPNAALVLETNSSFGYLTAFVDGKPLALEPKKILLPLSEIGAGKHLLAVRVYGEKRSNTGLSRLSTVYLPLLWHDDSRNEGWKNGWYQEECTIAGWQPVSNEFSKDPAGSGALEGWVRATINVPEDTVPFDALLKLTLNVSAVVYINGTKCRSTSPERMSQINLPTSLFHIGKNSVAIWVRYADRQSHGIEFNFTPKKPLVYRATVQATRDGQSLRALLNYDNISWTHHPTTVSMKINGQTIGGSIGQTGANIYLFAPYSLHIGDNLVEISMNHARVNHGLQSLEVIEIPNGMPTILPGWSQASRDATTGGWKNPTLNDNNWTAVPTTLVQQYDKSWIVNYLPQLEKSGMLYCTHLVLSASELQQNLTLFLRHAAVTELFVNGHKVIPDEEWYYSLNSFLKPGDNLIAFAPNRVSYRGLNLEIPDGREGYAQMPLLITDRAPLIPAHPLLSAFRINRVFPVASLPVIPENATILFSWPNGAPAVLAQKLGEHWEATAAPGIFSDLFPAPNITTTAKVNGSSNTLHYEQTTRLNHDGFIGDRTDQLLPAILAAISERPSIISAQAESNKVLCKIAAPDKLKCVLSWRILDWEGTIISSGTSPIENNIAILPLPELSDTSLPEGSALGRFVRVRMALLSEDRRIPYAFLDRHFTPNTPVDIYLHLDRKTDGRSMMTAPVADRILHSSSGQLIERFIYLPNETINATTTIRNSEAKPNTLELSIVARPALTGKAIQFNKEITLPAYGEMQIPMLLDSKTTAIEQPWQITARITLANNIMARAIQQFVIATPRGAITPLAEVTRANRSAGGYMWFMSNHAFPIEHLIGTDAEPVPAGNEWWTKVRRGGDGNWLVAEGIHRGGGGGDQSGMLWGPFYDQYRGEIIDSYGWFPNGENIRSWWAPYAMREVLRLSGSRSVVLNMSDWWQYDAGYPKESYATLLMFNQFLLANKGETIAGKLLDGKPIVAPTMKAMLDTIAADYQQVYAYFHAAGLARSAEYTGKILNTIAPGSTQWGQGAYAGILPATVGGITLGPQWASAESQGSLDADNHPFAGDWQYGIETTTFRAIGIENHLLTHWEQPMDYHRDISANWSTSALPADRWRRRLLDSRWLMIADQQGRFQRVLNTTHEESAMNDIMPDMPQANIGHGNLPYHWFIKDRLANLAMTISPKKPLSPLLLIGESQLDWTQYYGTLGKLRDAGLSLGGGISLATLAKMKSTDIPALVWLVAEQVDGKLLEAVVEKINDGVPILLVGHVPAAIGPGPDMRKLLGVSHLTTPITDPVSQNVAPAIATWPETRGLAQIPELRQGNNNYQSLPGGMEELITRNGRIMLARKGKVIFYGMVPKALWDLDDPAVNRVTIRALYEAMHSPISWPAALSGYAFQGEDDNLYLVVENMRELATNATISVHAPLVTGKWQGADMLAGKAIAVKSLADGIEIPISLEGGNGTILMLTPIKP